jgi:hypothetical protein
VRSSVMSVFITSFMSFCAREVEQRLSTYLEVEIESLNEQRRARLNPIDAKSTPTDTHSATAGKGVKSLA